MAFNEFYEKIYGIDHWRILCELMRSEKKKVVLNNPFGSSESEYLLDPASITAPAALSRHAGSGVVQVLDSCAAPGGKSLALIYGFGTKAQFWINDSSVARSGRLKKNLKDNLPEKVFAALNLSCRDSSLLFRIWPQYFTHILADVPCSGERNLLRKGRADSWTEKKSKRMAQRQYAILASLWQCLKPGGILVYSTCSLSPHENDGVVAKLIKRKDEEVEVLPADADMGAVTAHGRLILPTAELNVGPFYFSVLGKNQKVPMAK